MASWARFKNALLKKSYLNLWVLSFFTFTILCEISLVFFEKNSAIRVWSGVSSLLRNEKNLLNSYDLSKNLADMEKTGWIDCVILTETSHNPRIFYNTSTQPSCGSFFISKAKGEIFAINGSSWFLSFRIPSLTWLKFFQIILPLIIFLIHYVIFQRIKILRLHRLNFEESKQMQIDRLELEAKSAQQQAQLAQQVAHDIRSPLSALNLVINSSNNLPEAQRVMVRVAAQRINDIANGLIRKQKQILDSALEENKTISIENQFNMSHLKIENTMIMALLDQIVSEKRTQYREKMQIHIDGDFHQGYGLFAQVDCSELSRVVSNLINNSVEAFARDQQGNITVKMFPVREEYIQIEIKDNGQGIPEDVLKRLGQRGFSHGKIHSDSGSGLGVYHATNIIKTFGGQLEYQSKEGEGTTVVIQIPQSTAPLWFVEQLHIQQNQQIVVCDDDASIHDIWKERLGTITSFTSGKELLGWAKQQAESQLQDTLFLIDYELLGQTMNGLDLAEELQLKNAILVTSRYEEEFVRKRCEVMSVKLIPKQLAYFVPILKQT